MLPDAVKMEKGPDEDETRPAPRRRMRRVAAWQMLAAMALVLVAVVGLFQVAGLGIRLRPSPTLTPTATLLPTATALPTVIPTDTPAPMATLTPVPVVMAGGKVVVKGTEGQQLRLRAGPALIHVTLRIVEEGTMLKVLEGPEAADGFQWWKVETDDVLTAWAAGNWLVPIAP